MPPPARTSRDLQALPKAHLHLHIEGCARAATVAELAGRAGVPVPTALSFPTFSDFMDAYTAVCGLLRCEADLRRVVREVVLDAAAAGVVYLEPQLYPPLHEQRFGSAQRVVEIVLDELATAGATAGVATGLMLVADRGAPVELGEEQARVATRYAGCGVVAFGLIGDERTGPAERHAAAFATAQEAGLLCVPHAGERAGPDSVRAALRALRADRLGHGVRAVEDPALVAHLGDHHVVLDVCPTSNLLMGACASLAEHPLPKLLAAGVPCSLNTDDSLLFGCDLLAEYRLCRDALGLDDEDLAAIARASLTGTGAPASTVVDAQTRITAWLRGG